MPARLTLQPHPFDARDRRTLELVAGARLAELLPGPSSAWAVTRNGRTLEPEVLPALELAEGDIVSARALPQLPAVPAIVAVLAKMGAAYVLGQGAAAVLVGAVAGAIASALVARALAPDVSKQAGAPSAQPFYSVAGARNQLRPFGSIPAHYGRLRVVPDLLAPVVTTVSASGDLSVRALFCVGVGRYGGISAVGDSIKIGSQAVASLGLTRFAVYNGLADADPPSETLEPFGANVFEEPLGLELHHVAVEGSAEQIRTTADQALGFDVTLVFAQGLWRISDSNHQQNLTLRVVVRYRVVGESAWVTLADEALTGFIAERFSKLYHGDPPGAAQYEVSVKLHAMLSRGLYTKDRGGTGGSIAMTGDAIWTSLRTYLLGDAVNDVATDDVTMFGLELAASELVSGALDQVTAFAPRLLPTWSLAGGWSDVALGERNPAAYTDTNNPAWAYANELREAGIPDDEIDTPQLLRWAQFCTVKGWTCNWQQTEELTLEASLDTIASCGQAFRAMRGSLWTAIFDEPREPVAAFGPHNMRELTITQTPIERVDAIRVRFANAVDAEGRLDERVIYFGGHSAATAEAYRTADVLNGLTDPVLVERYIRLERLKAQRRSTSYRWKSDWSAAVVEVGDVVVLQYHGASLGDAQAECTGYSTRDAGAHLDEVFVHPAVRIEAGRTYSLRVRARGAAASGAYRVLSIPLSNPVLAGVQQLSALPVDGSVNVPTYTTDGAVVVPDDLVGQPAFVGEPEQGLVVVTDVTFEGPGTCGVSAVDFAPEIFDEALLETPHTSTVSPQALANLAPAAPALAAPVFSRLVGHLTGSYPYPIYEYVLPVAPPAAFPRVVSYKTQYRYWMVQNPALDTGGRTLWQSLADVPAPTSQVLVGPIPRTRPIDLRIWAISSAGAPSAPLFVGGAT